MRGLFEFSIRPERLQMLSNCLQCQAGFVVWVCLAASHIAWSLSMALRMVRSLRMHATVATFFGLPAAISRL